MSDRIKNLKKETLSNFWGKLEKATYDFQRSDGRWEQQIRESYDHGNGAAVLLFNPEKRTVILVRQLRICTYLNGHKDGMILEVPAGLVEGLEPEECIKKEIEEETGYRVKTVQKLFESYMTPGSVTESDHLFFAEYSDEMKVNEGGGMDEEQEDIEVLEIDFDQAFDLIASGGIIDAKTIILLQWAKIHLKL